MSVVPLWADVAPKPRHQSGFTLLELIIVIILVILLFLTAWWRLLPLRGDAEAAHVATTIGTLRSALGMHVAERIVKDSLESAEQLDKTNPMDLLARAPSSYVGEVSSKSDSQIEPGTWYFDRSSGRLHYRVRFPQYLTDSSLEAPVDLAWQIQLSYRNSNENEAASDHSRTLQSVRLVALDNPGWKAPEENIAKALDES